MSDTQNTPLTPVQIAETIVAFGWTPIGLNGKQPITKEWQKTSRTGAIDKIKGFFQVNPQVNVGVLTGKASGIVVADIEAPNVNAWLELVDKNGMPRTFVIMTGSGGFHYYFKADEKVRNLSSTKIKGIGDYLADGRQAVFAGSINYEKQTQYTVIEGYDVEAQSGDRYPVLASMPDWLVTYINPNAHLMPSIMPSGAHIGNAIQPPTIMQQLHTAPAITQQAPPVVPEPAPVVPVVQPASVVPTQTTIELPQPIIPTITQTAIPTQQPIIPTIIPSQLSIPIVPTIGKPTIPTIQPTLTN